MIGPHTSILDVSPSAEEWTALGAFQSEPYWDEGLKGGPGQNRLSGETDPETDEVVPTKAKDGRKVQKMSDTVNTKESAAGAGESVEALRAEIAARDAEIETLRAELEQCRETLRAIIDAIEKMGAW